MSVACVEYVSDCRNCGLDHTIFLKKDGSVSGMVRPGDLKYSSAYDTEPGSGNGRHRHHCLNCQDFPHPATLDGRHPMPIRFSPIQNTRPHYCSLFGSFQTKQPTAIGG